MSLAPGTHVFPDCKIVVRDLEPGEFVGGHLHEGGHVTIVDGDAEVVMLGAVHRTVHGALYVPAGVVHDIRAIGRTRMYCVGREDF